MREQYGVSRESLREALRLLEAQGLITIRRGPGGGPVVGRVDPASFGRISTLFYHLAGGTYAELFEAWALTESTLAERAARNRDRRSVRLAMRPFLEPPDGRWETATVDEFVRAHSRFHAAVASLAANRVLELMLQTIGQVVTRQITGERRPPAVWRRYRSRPRRRGPGHSLGASGHGPLENGRAYPSGERALSSEDRCPDGRVHPVAVMTGLTR